MSTIKLALFEIPEAEHTLLVDALFEVFKMAVRPHKTSGR